MRLCRHPTTRSLSPASSPFPPFPPGSYLKNGTCCDEASFYSRGRDFDIGDWCALRRAAGGCSLVTAGALLAAAAVCIFTRARNLTMLPTAILSLLAGACGGGKGGRFAAEAEGLCRGT